MFSLTQPTALQKKGCVASHRWTDRQVLTRETGCDSQEAEGSFQEENLPRGSRFSEALM